MLILNNAANASERNKMKLAFSVFYCKQMLAIVLPSDTFNRFNPSSFFQKSSDRSSVTQRDLNINI